MKLWRHMITEQAATILNEPKDSRKAVIDWLKECQKDSLTNDPSVGIFVSESMANIFQALINIVEG